MDDRYSIEFNAAINRNLLSNDIDPNDEKIIVTMVDGAESRVGETRILDNGLRVRIEQNGSVRVNSRDLDQVSETFTQTVAYTIANEQGGSDQANVVIEVVAPPPPPQSPSAPPPSPPPESPPPVSPPDAPPPPPPEPQPPASPPPGLPTNGDDNLTLGPSNGKVRAGDGNDVIRDGDGKDKVFGEGGNDTFIVGGGKDKFVGGDGLDTAVFAGSSTGYKIKIEGNGKIKVKDTDPLDGFDAGKNTLKKIEFLEFDDGTIDVRANLGTKNPPVAAPSASAASVAAQDALELETLVTNLEDVSTG